MENCSPGPAELPADVIRFCQGVPQIIWLCGFPGLPLRAAISSLAAVMEKMSTELHTGTPQRASTKSCKSEGLQWFILLCSKATVGGKQIQRSLRKKMGFGSLLQAKTIFFDISEGKGGKKYEYCTCSWVTFAPSKTPSPEPPAADCSHGPPTHDFGKAQKKWVRS